MSDIINIRQLEGGNPIEYQRKQSLRDELMEMMRTLHPIESENLLYRKGGKIFSVNINANIHNVEGTITPIPKKKIVFIPVSPQVRTRNVNIQIYLGERGKNILTFFGDYLSIEGMNNAVILVNSDHLINNNAQNIPFSVGRYTFNSWAMDESPSVSGLHMVFTVVQALNYDRYLAVYDESTNGSFVKTTPITGDGYVELPITTVCRS